jgi:hypothetical protein
MNEARVKPGLRDLILMSKCCYPPGYVGRIIEIIGRILCFLAVFQEVLAVLSRFWPYFILKWPYSNKTGHTHDQRSKKERCAQHTKKAR